VPATPYPEEYQETVRQAQRERDSGFEPRLRETVRAIAAYDVVFLGFPIWGTTAPSVIRSNDQPAVLYRKFEVTQQQWESVIGSNPYFRDRSNPFYNLPGMPQRITRPDHSATVSWNYAQEFIAALNAREGHQR
jgi:hypothetical protein